MVSVMQTLEALLKALVARPEESAIAWLVIADWLEENDDPRWEFIRLRHDSNYRPDLGPEQRGQRLLELLATGLRPCLPRLTNSIGMQLVWIPPGTFRMGTDKHEGDRPGLPPYSDETRVHEVEITQPFYLGIFPVTQEEYRKVTGQNPSYFAESGAGKDLVKGSDTKRFPVDSVSWDEAVAFCQLLSSREERSVYRLPTEAEWEYACRGGAVLTNATSYSPPPTPDYPGGYPMDWDGPAHGGYYPFRPSPVGSYEANALGLHDMCGNVWEWCSDWYDEHYYERSPRQDPQGPAEPVAGRPFRICRGGWWYDDLIDGLFCGAIDRPWFEFGHPCEVRSLDRGFRVACVPPATSAEF